MKLTEMEQGGRSVHFTHVTGYVSRGPRSLEGESVYRQLVALSTKIMPRLLVFCLKWEHVYNMSQRTEAAWPVICSMVS